MIDDEQVEALAARIAARDGVDIAKAKAKAVKWARKKAREEQARAERAARIAADPQACRCPSIFCNAPACVEQRRAFEKEMQARYVGSSGGW